MLTHTHMHTHTGHTNRDFLCFAASCKKHPDVSSSPTTLPEYKGALWCRKATPKLFSQETQSETMSQKTHMHIPNSCYPSTIQSVLCACSFPGMDHWGKPSFSTCLKWSAIGRGKWEAKLASEIVSFCLQMCLFASFSSLSCLVTNKETWQ